ncbi:MAG: decaprenyl-phosphate phosphoribosyltransferase [Anaerolineae bacterium]|nr:decaprenyl-phosphate phosphoribosyltransferase [Anaerolineae bacterium]
MHRAPALPASSLVELMKTMRPKQWAKQAFVLAALVFDGKLFQPYFVVRTLLAVLVFSLISGAVYALNDLADVEKDRTHPSKRHRPLASGRLSPAVAGVAVLVLVAVSLATAYLLSPGFLLVTALYFGLNVAYSYVLKDLLILDLLAIAAGFVLRVVAGVVVVDVARFSPWLYVCTTLLALFIAINKRRHEYVLLAENAENHRSTLAGYTLPLLDQFSMVVISATLMAYSLYTFSAPNLPDNHSMMLTIPFVIYGLFRYMYLVQVKGMGGAPEEIVLRDKPLILDVLLWSLAVGLVLYVFS